jgi:hypothetical protein
MSNREKLMLSFVMLVICVLFLTQMTYAQSVLQTTSTPAPRLTPTPESSPTPNATSTMAPQAQKLSALELQEFDKRLDELETELIDLNSPLSGFWSALGSLLAAILSSGWLLVAVVFLFLFRSQVGDILRALPSKMSNAKIRFGDNEITLGDVDNVVLEREILKTMIFVATIDSDPSPLELKCISERSSQMNSKLDVLEVDDKRRIIQAAIDLAVVDKDFKNEEYGAIKAKAAQYNISEAYLNHMIEEVCHSNHVELPEVLARGTKNP